MGKSKQILLEEIKSDILTQNVCPDLAKQATQLVMSDGKPDADIVFIGEAPGKNEDIQGKPFVGASGKLLNQILTNVGMRREDIYITNIVKYRPPANRDPLPAEKLAFWPYLVRQLEVIEPKLVVTLGRHSMEYFLPGHKIRDIHGKVQTVKVGSTNKRFTLLPLYHPTAVIYNRKLLSVFQDDLAAIPTILQKII